MRSKDDIEFHGLGHGYARVPAVNVKIRDTVADGFRKWERDNPDHDPRFTEEWIEEHVNDQAHEWYWQFAIENAWEMLQNDAEEIYGRGVKVYSEGRSGGWAYINGINQDTADWDAIEFTKWKRFAKVAREYANGVMYDIVDSIYFNKFDTWADEQSELAAPDIEQAHLTRVQ